MSGLLQRTEASASSCDSRLSERSLVSRDDNRFCSCSMYQYSQFQFFCNILMIDLHVHTSKLTKFTCRWFFFFFKFWPGASQLYYPLLIYIPRSLQQSKVQPNVFALYFLCQIFIRVGFNNRRQLRGSCIWEPVRAFLWSHSLPPSPYHLSITLHPLVQLCGTH